MGEIRTRITKEIFHGVTRDLKAGKPQIVIQSKYRVGHSSIREIRRAKTWPGFERSKAEKASKRSGQSRPSQRQLQVRVAAINAIGAPNSGHVLFEKSARPGKPEPWMSRPVGREEFNGLYDAVRELRDDFNRYADAHQNKRGLFGRRTR